MKRLLIPLFVIIITIQCHTKFSHNPTICDSIIFKDSIILRDSIISIYHKVLIPKYYDSIRWKDSVNYITLWTDSVNYITLWTDSINWIDSINWKNCSKKIKNKK